MAFNAWKDIPLADGRSGPIYRIYDAVNNRLSGALFGTWTEVDRSSGALWANDTDPPNGSWIVIESQYARADGAKVQIFVGYRSSVGDLAGFGSLGAGIYSCMSPIGGWDYTNHYFGSSLTDWRNDIHAWTTSYVGACTMTSLFFTRGETNRPGSFCCVIRSGSGANYGCYAGALAPLSGLDEGTSRVAHFYGQVNIADGGSYWGRRSNDTFSAGRVPNVGLTTFGYACAGWANFNYSMYVPVADRETSGKTEVVMPVLDSAQAYYSVGLMEEIRITNMADGDISTDGTRHAWTSISFPREASRDGSWV